MLAAVKIMWIIMATAKLIHCKSSWLEWIPVPLAYYPNVACMLITLFANSAVCCRIDVRNCIPFLAGHISKQLLHLFR
jgi:hypothetical protein